MVLTNVSAQVTGNDFGSISKACYYNYLSVIFMMLLLSVLQVVNFFWDEKSLEWEVLNRATNAAKCPIHVSTKLSVCLRMEKNTHNPSCVGIPKITGEYIYWVSATCVYIVSLILTVL
jgi:hypothetical protein